MAKGTRCISRAIITLVAIIGMCGVTQLAFLPPVVQPRQQAVHSLIPAAVGVGAMIVATPPASADNLQIAGKKFANTVYPIVKQIDWVTSPEVTKWMAKQGTTWNPKLLVAAMRSVLQEGMEMDPALVRSAVEAHSNAIETSITSGSNLAAPIEKFEDITVAMARMLASAGVEKNMAVYDASMKLGIGSLNNEFFGGFTPFDTSASYRAFLELAQEARKAAVA